MSSGSPAIHTKPVSRAAVNSARAGTTHAAGLVSNNGPASMRGITEVPALLLPLVNRPPQGSGHPHSSTTRIQARIVLDIRLRPRLMWSTVKTVPRLESKGNSDCERGGISAADQAGAEGASKSFSL